MWKYTSGPYLSQHRFLAIFKWSEIPYYNQSIAYNNPQPLFSVLQQEINPQQWRISDVWSKYTFFTSISSFNSVILLVFLANLLIFCWSSKVTLTSSAACKEERFNISYVNLNPTTRSVLQSFWKVVLEPPHSAYTLETPPQEHQQHPVWLHRGPSSTRLNHQLSTAPCSHRLFPWQQRQSNHTTLRQDHRSGQRHASM